VIACSVFEIVTAQALDRNSREKSPAWVCFSSCNAGTRFSDMRACTNIGKKLDFRQPICSCLAAAFKSSAYHRNVCDTFDRRVDPSHRIQYVINDKRGTLNRCVWQRLPYALCSKL
jgi:hypothetical protein